MKVALAQLNPLVGDFAGNCQAIAAAYRRAVEQGAELVVFSELVLCGYPPLDLLQRPAFLQENQSWLERLAGQLGPVPALVGCALPNPEPVGRPALNVAALLAGGHCSGQVVKSRLPSYEVFDEERYFEPATRNEVVEVGNLRLAVTICEDIWPGPTSRPRYRRDPVGELVAGRPELLVNLSASPFAQGKLSVRQQVLAEQARRLGTPAVLVNQVGGNDELVFDGRSLALDAQGRLLARAAAFAEDLLVVDLAAGTEVIRPSPADGPAEIMAALCLGLSDYARKCGFRRAVLGVSGGIDSALCAVLACRALGSDNVHLLAMPSDYSSPQSARLAQRLAANLGAHFEQIDIEPILQQYRRQLDEPLGPVRGTLVEENLQARIRGALVMAAANRLGALALATGNKSELATGYCTIYGDMVGGLAPLGDIYKTDVYRLVEHINGSGEVIPRAIVERPPSAELRPGQLDSDSLPPYDRLDHALRLYLEEGLDAGSLAETLQDAELARRVVRLVQGAEFKRRQAAPVLKVSNHAFGMGWRQPLARFRS